MKINRNFYQRSALEVAPELLGLVLVHNSDQGLTKGKIVEVEAYMGNLDKAAHSYNNRSVRTEIQYGEGGYAYIYMIYGMHYCMNIVTNTIDIPEAILIRALEPMDGIDLMMQRRQTNKLINLCNGPGKLCSAMGINKDNYGMDLCGEKMYLESSKSLEPLENIASKRMNIDYAGEAKDYLWRFTIKDSKYISTKIKL